MNIWVKEDLRARWFGHQSLYLCTALVVLDGVSVEVDVSHDTEFGWRFWHGSGVTSGYEIIRNDCVDYKGFVDGCLSVVEKYLRGFKLEGMV